MCLIIAKNVFYFTPSTNERSEKKYNVDDKGYREGSNPKCTRRYVGRFNIPQIICTKILLSLNQL